MIPFEIRNKIKQTITEFFTELFSADDYKNNLDIKDKGNQSIVTKADLFICEKIHEEISKLKSLKDCNYFSEENHGKLEFPGIILDPIDGTRELVKGFPECSLSLAMNLWR